jgi:adenylate cyclase
VHAALDAQDAMAEIEVEGHRPQLRAGVHWGRPRKLGGDYLGVDVNIAARVCDAAKAGQVLVSDPALTQLGQDGVVRGRRKRLRAAGTPRELGTTPVTRA